ncbi:hypothetical protein EG327_001223 [Venturia inaequalis]|uniref:Uncharacterized protein n=1 Tax=Venturia inaequalis TaxID=5025 RepID=A0A8H3ZJH2_VENIN|nr:hypothetical protein EG327_001223 [Venturia inaequalis]
MGITNPFSDRYRSTSLSDLTFSSDEESGHASPLTDFSVDESGPPSPLTASGIDEETGKYIAVELGSTGLQDAPLYRSFGGRGALKSCDDMLLAALVYQEPDKKPRLLRANRSMNDVFPLRRGEPIQPCPDILPDFYDDEEIAQWSTTAQRASPAYFAERLDYDEDSGYDDINPSASFHCTEQDEISDQLSRLPTSNRSPHAVLYHVSWRYEVEVTSFLIDHIGASENLILYGLLVTDVDVDDFKGSVITTLASTVPLDPFSLFDPLYPQHFRQLGGLLHTGEAILVPEFHDPLGIIHYLLERGGIWSSPVQPHIPKPVQPRIPKPVQPHIPKPVQAPIPKSPNDKEKVAADENLLSTCVLDEARRFALRMMCDPTMAKWKPREVGEPRRKDSDVISESVWYGWNLLLNPAGNRVRTEEEEKKWELTGFGDGNWEGTGFEERNWDLRVGV